VPQTLRGCPLAVGPLTGTAASAGGMLTMPTEHAYENKWPFLKVSLGGQKIIYFKSPRFNDLKKKVLVTLLS